MTHLVPLSEALAAVRPEHREIAAEAARWSSAAGRALDPDVFTLLCAGAAGFDGTDSLTSWTRVRTCHVLRCDVPNWCSRHRCLWPLEISEAMWDWFGFLEATDRLDADSDPVWELRKPLICYGGLDLRGRLRSEGDGRGQLVPCECFLPYRETVAALHGLLDGSRSGASVVSELDPGGDLRWSRLRRDLRDDGDDDARFDDAWADDGPPPGDGWPDDVDALLAALPEVFDARSAEPEPSDGAPPAAPGRRTRAAGRSPGGRRRNGRRPRPGRP
ncbi:hypothetical protein [Pseudonocardia sp. H11422]|uniref:hypothetical protein n=1 Tax=Pseudonocardia sp. H11422 TaxID=2835866 RepID=UPI001BDCE7B9|nr:hypothetical protein [Pseudonocardia sp. H11422]